MTKTQIDKIIATRDPDLLIDALWEDTAIMARVRSNAIADLTPNIREFCVWRP